tara:strand:+ start:100 stop:864 length:765 start_codon:yes stop_codon:yes gene_type:complete
MINSVRNTVLFLLNKDNRGYISPLEYNHYAKLAQLEIFESYFSEFARQTQLQNTRKRSLGYGDMALQVRNKIDVFSTSATLEYTDVQDGGVVSVGEARDYFTLPSNYYKLINLTYNGRVLEEIPKGKFDMIMNSNLNVPSVTYPVFYREGNQVYARPLSIYYTGTTPQTVNNVVETALICNYLRKPADPIWAYTTVSGDPVYNQAASTNFEISENDEVDLIIKICKYAGLAIREADVVTAMTSKESLELQTDNT